MHAATYDAAPVCSTTDQAKVLLIAEYKSYMFGLFKFTLLGLSGEHTIYNKLGNVISSNIIEGRGQGKSCEREGWKNAKQMREVGMLLSYRPFTADECEANTIGKLDTRSESRERAFDHHDMLDT